jgi:hypothetical protein
MAIEYGVHDPPVGSGLQRFKLAVGCSDIKVDNVLRIGFPRIWGGVPLHWMRARSSFWYDFDILEWKPTCDGVPSQPDHSFRRTTWNRRIFYIIALLPRNSSKA